MGTGIKPGRAAAEQFDIQVALGPVSIVDVCNFQFSPGRRGDLLGDPDYVIIKKIKAGHRIIGFWIIRLFFQACHTPISIESDNTVSLRVLDIVSENGGTGLFFCNSLQPVR